MNKQEFDDGIPAAGCVLDVNEVLAIGSQATRGFINTELSPEAFAR